ncbi:hypothetical protein FCM35_KLT05754 [Carex littledalei]|uniref:Transmembrane protein n=1 Tax=Carex littledalei TaxID=544730 RepID=A0A833V8L4_9POAL|nr:hypothetical protein FCM35_KLT05754 [Carex littledalei]
MALKSLHLLSIILLILTIVGAAFVPSVVATRPGVRKSSAKPLNKGQKLPPSYPVNPIPDPYGPPSNPASPKPDPYGPPN